MAFQSVPDTAEVSVVWTANGQRCSMTFDFTKVVNYTQGDIDQLALAADVWAVNELVPLLSSQVMYEGVFVRGLESQIDLEASETGNAQVGGTGSVPLTNHSCLSVKRVTGFTGRSARGRVYFPLTVTDVDATNEDFVGTASANSILAALDEIIDVDGGVGWDHCIVSRIRNGVVLAPAVRIPVTGYVVVDREIDTQRRRMASK